MQDTIKEIDNFIKNRVWVTKKIRMESEARLKRNLNMANIVINYYTFTVLAFSIWALVLDTNSELTKYVTLMTVISSVGLFGVSLLISSLAYRERALQFKESYLKLDSLESDFKNLLRIAYRLKKDELIDQFYFLEKKYFDILALSDNHDQVDTEKLFIDRELKGFEIFIKSYNKYLCNRRAIIIVLFALPMLLTIILVWISYIS